MTPETRGARRPFLTAQWLDLALFNWPVPAELLAAYVPHGTELDCWDGHAYVSLVGFRFANTRLVGLPVPFHVNFVEINLRFYVRRQCGDETRRGVVFIKEIAPRRCITLIARRVYHENYVTLPTWHRIERRDERLDVCYQWRFHGQTQGMTVAGALPFRELKPGSHEEFILENYWGYTRRRSGGTIEYRVHHPRWQIASVDKFSLVGEFVAPYGEPLGTLLRTPPASVLLANGSAVAVDFGCKV
jgi:uncharacterized protein YqjF (DUF2071 family)